MDIFYMYLYEYLYISFFSLYMYLYEYYYISLFFYHNKQITYMYINSNNFMCAITFMQVHSYLTFYIVKKSLNCGFPRIFR